MTTQNKKSYNKTATIITYVIAVLCLLAGLFAPLYGKVLDNSAYKAENAMLFMYLPALFNSAFGTALHVNGWPEDITREAYTKQLYGFDINPLVWLLLAYTVVTVVALFFLIPVILGKKEKKTSAVCAYVMEVIALLVLAAYYIIGATVCGRLIVTERFNLLIAAGGLLLILIIQAFINKKSLGAVKVVLAILSGAAVACLFNVSNVLQLILPEGAWQSFSGSFLTTLNSNLGFAVVNGQTIYGKHGIGLLMDLDLLKNAFAGGDIWLKVFYAGLIGTAAVALLNLMIDIIGLATGSKYAANNTVNPNKGSKIFGLVRYIILLVLVATDILALFLANGTTVGIVLYFLAIIVLIQVIIAIVRVCRIRGQVVRAKESVGIKLNDSTMSAANTEESYVVADGEAEERPATQVSPYVVTANSAAPAATAEQPQNTETHTIIYNVKTIYNGPTDAFIDTLTAEEKVEFAKIFLENKSQSPTSVKYELGEANEDFFTDIFINLSSSRTLLSKGLLNKIYKHLTAK